MTITENILTISLTVAGSVAIAFINFYLEGRKKRITLFKALYDEIRLNYSVADKILKIKRDQGIFELSPLYTLSYKNIRTTGELLSLPKEMRRELEDVYEAISAHNRQLPAVYEIIPRDRGFYERLEGVAQKLKYLENGLPKILRFLK